MPVHKVRVCVSFETPGPTDGHSIFLKDTSKFEGTFTDRITYDALRSQIQTECASRLPPKWEFEGGGVHLGIHRIEGYDATHVKHTFQFEPHRLLTYEELEKLDPVTHKWIALCVVVKEIT